MAYHRAMTDLGSLGAVTAAGAMRRGEITAEGYATALLARCSASAALNAFISIQPDAVLEAARGAGVQSAAAGVASNSVRNSPAEGGRRSVSFSRQRRRSCSISRLIGFDVRWVGGIGALVSCFSCISKMLSASKIYCPVSK